MMKNLVLIGLVFTTFLSAQTWSTRKGGEWIEDYYYPLNPGNDQSELQLHRAEIHGWSLGQKVFRKFNLFNYALNTGNFFSGEEFHHKKSMYSLMKFSIESAVVEHTDILSSNTAPDYTKPHEMSHKVTNLKFDNVNALNLSTSGFYNMANSKDIFTGILAQSDFDKIHAETKSLQKATNSNNPNYQRMARKQIKWFQEKAVAKSGGGWKSKKNAHWYDSYLPDENCDYYFYNDAEISGPGWADRIYTYRESICGTIYLNFNNIFTNPQVLLQTIRDNFILSLKMNDSKVEAPSVIAIFEISGREYEQYLNWFGNFLYQPLVPSMNNVTNYFDPSMIQVYTHPERNQIVMKITHKNK
ncbi:hypothetical protein N9N67_08145 [Bacteriovoracaceae bacterium]|nr:hypothetical protein [Bacteriovoracaceae bacterium]